MITGFILAGGSMTPTACPNVATVFGMGGGTPAPASLMSMAVGSSSGGDGDGDGDDVRPLDDAAPETSAIFSLDLYFGRCTNEPKFEQKWSARCSESLRKH